VCSRIVIEYDEVVAARRVAEDMPRIVPCRSCPPKCGRIPVG